VSIKDHPDQEAYLCRSRKARTAEEAADVLRKHLAAVEAERDNQRARADRLVLALGEYAGSVERDRREPDKVLCHVQSMRGRVLRETL
jgi:Arc/MetJ-type ribon-helix-helix transcriptional regulator